MKLLAFSDVHRDWRQAQRLVDLSRDVDVVVGAGDFASVHVGLGRVIDELRSIQAPAVLVPGNNETEDALRRACASWTGASVLHGQTVRIDGVEFFGLGAGVPRTPLLVQGPHVKCVVGGLSGSVLVRARWCVCMVGGMVIVVRAGAQPCFGPRPSGWLRGRRHDV